MNRRQFLHRAALALGGALLAPLVGVVKRADAADDDYSMDEFVADFKRAQANYAAVADFLPAEWNHATLAEGTWVKAFDPADIERAFAEPVETWDFPTTTTIDNYIEDDWGATTRVGDVLTMDDLLRARRSLRDADGPPEWGWDHLRLGWEHAATGEFVPEYAAITEGDAAVWGNTVHIQHVEDLAAWPGHGAFTRYYHDGTAWREVGDG